VTKTTAILRILNHFTRRMNRESRLSLMIAFASAILLSLPVSARAQTGTGQGVISGIVTDSSGASVPHASVAIRNNSTNVIIKVTTNDTGYYELRDLNPGTYEISIDASGFEKMIDSGVILEADDHPSINLALKLGSHNETIVVNGISPLIDTQSAGIGQVLTSEEMSALPNGQAPIWLAMLSPGVQSNYAQNYQLGGADPSWNGGGPQFGAFGRIGANEFSLDGAPNMSNQRGQAINLSAEELGQTSVNITQFDASVGHTYGISLTQTTKSGTNDLHGGLRYRRYDLRYFAKQHFQRLNYVYAVGRDGCKTDPSTAQCQLDQNQFGYPGSHMNYGDAGIGGPVFIPKLFDGRNKLFFFVGVLMENPNNASSNTIAVPSTQDKAGNFSDLGCAAGQTAPCGAPVSSAPVNAQSLFTAAGCSTYYGQYQLYNPYSVTMVNGRPSRTPFCGNVIPSNLISTLPLVKTINSYLPAPNYGTAPTGNNFIYEAGGYNQYREVTNRYDYAVNNADHIFFRWSRGHYTLHNSTFLQNNFMGYHQDKWIDIGALGWSHILSPKTFVDVTVGGMNYNGGGFTYPSEQQLPSTLGLPTYVDQYAGSAAQFPILSISSYQQIGGTDFNNPIYRTLAFRGNLTTVRGSSTWRAGAEWRQQHVDIGGPGASNTTVGPSGQYSFDATYTQQNDGSNADCANGCNLGLPGASSTGPSYAAFLMGVQTTSTVTTVPETARSNPYYAFYAGDTWRVSRKLTLVPGVRYEFEYGPTEKHNRQIVGWDPNAPLTISAIAQTAYQAALGAATAAQRAVLPTNLEIKGGPIYAGVNGASTRQWENNWRILPRIGAAYSINSTTVIRAGVGMYYDTLNVLNESSTIDTDGFTASTTSASSTTYGANFVPGVSPLANPFPLSNGTRFAPSVGSSLGADYYAGTVATGTTIGIYPHDREPARSARVQFSIEHQIGRSLVVQLAYVGSRTTNITLDGNQNNTRTQASGFQTATAVPGSFYAGGSQPNSANNTLLSSQISNPFYIGNLGSLQLSDPVYYNMLSKSNYSTTATLPISDFVRPYPQISNLRFYPSVGTSQFQEFQANVSKRISNGLVANFAYQKNLQYDRDFYENQFDARPSLESSLISPPWRMTGTWVYTFPFGRTQKFARDGVMSTILGGFRLSGSWEANPGTLLTFSGNGSPNGTPNIFFVGNPNSIRIRNNSSFNTSGTTPTIYGFNTQAATAVSSSVNGIVTCSYTGTGFVLNTTCQPNNYNLRDFPRHVEGVRSEDLENWNANLGRTFNPNERLKVEARADLYNAFNHQRVAAVGGAQMNPTNSQFGQVTSDNGNGREIIYQLLMTF
jgi:hypothetical protein